MTANQRWCMGNCLIDTAMITSRFSTRLTTLRKRRPRRYVFLRPSELLTSAPMSTRILVAGDHFILPSIFAEAIRAEVKTDIEFREYQSPWPGVPFGEIGEVTEASGSEDEIIQALQGASIYVANHAPLTKRVLEVRARSETCRNRARRSDQRQCQGGDSAWRSRLQRSRTQCHSYR